MAMDFSPSAGSTRPRFRLAIPLLYLWAFSLVGCYEPSSSVSPDVTVDTLIRLLQDRDVVTRRTAAEALGKIGDHRAISGLALRLQDERSVVREAAVRSLGQCGPLIGADATRIAGLLGDPNPAVRAAAVQTLGSLEGVSELWPAIRGQLDHDDPEMRLVVIQAIEGADSPEVLRALSITLHDSDPQVRRAVVVSLAESRAPQVVALLRDRVSRDASSEVRAEAAYRLQFFSGQDGVEDLKRVAEHDEHSQVRRWAGQTLRELGVGRDFDSKLRPVPPVAPGLSHRYP